MTKQEEHKVLEQICDLALSSSSFVLQNAAHNDGRIFAGTGKAPPKRRPRGRLSSRETGTCYATGSWISVSQSSSDSLFQIPSM